MEEKKIRTLTQQVETCLRTSEETRNSDIKLTQLVWYKFYRKFVGSDDRGFFIRINDLFVLPSQDAIKRVRAKLQNDEGKYPPTDERVALQRGWKVEDWRRALGYHVESNDQLVMET